MFTALVRFHLRAGVRLAWRAAAPAVGLPVVFILLQQDPAGAALAFSISLVCPSGGAAPLMGFGLVAFAYASWAGPRLAPGMTGWFRHLPATRAAISRAALAGLLAAQLPLLVAYGLAMSLALGRGRPVSPSRFLAALVIVLASASLAKPRASAVRAAPLRPAPLPLPVTLLSSVRALGPALVTGSILALLPVGAAAAFRVNNPDIPRDIASAAARLGAGLGVAVLVSFLVERLVARRPPWAWARSLPVGSFRRVDADAVLLGIPALVPLAVTARMDPLASLLVAACLPAAALRAAGAVRGNTGTKAGPAARLLAECALLAGCLALVPAIAAALVAIAPLVRRAAARADRDQKVSTWEERRHAAAGDSFSWSAR